MNKLIVPAVIVATGMVAAAAWSQTPAPVPNPNVKIYYTTPLENDASRIVRLQSVTIPAKDWEGFEAWANRPPEEIAGLKDLARKAPTWQK